MSDTGFTLNAQLQSDTLYLRDWPLCRVLLMNNVNLPWLILVPRRIGIREVFELNIRDQHQLNAESTALAEALMAEFTGHKMNIAALGNVVSQLHIHHVVRYQYDAVWPKPVWGELASKPYSADKRKQMLSRLNTMLDRVRLS